jgi:hypothetical protein
MSVDVTEYAWRKAWDSYSYQCAIVREARQAGNYLFMWPDIPNEAMFMPKMNIGDLYGADAKAAHEPNRPMTAGDLGINEKEGAT